MNDPLDEHIIELGWRQQLTKAEEAEIQAHLTRHPEAREAMEANAELTRLLERVPEAPAVASNFTALVMQAIEREATAKQREGAVVLRGWWRSWLPKAAVAVLLVGTGFLGVYQHQLHARTLMARQVARVAVAFSNLGQEPVKHFDQIQRYADAPPAADTELSAMVASMQ